MATYYTTDEHDKSLKTRDSSIDVLINAGKSFATNASVGIAIQNFATNASIGTAVFAKNASLALYELTINVDSSFGLYYTKTQIDTSFGLYATNASTGLALAPFATNASVGIAIQNFSTNASVNTALNAYTTNASISTAAFTKNASLDLYLLNTTDSFTGNLTINGSISLFGDIIQNGSTYITHAEQIYTTKDFITMRDGASVAIGDGSISGIRIVKPNGTNNVILGVDNNSIMRVGWEPGRLVALAGREDFPTNGYYAYWDDSSTIFKTRDLKGYIDGSIAGFATNASVGLAIQNFSINASVNTALGAYTTNASISTAAFAKNASLALYELATNVDTSFGLYSTTAQMNTALGYRDTSITGIWTKFNYVDTSLNNLGIKNAAQDTSLNSIWTNFDLYATNASIVTAGFEKKLDVDTSFGLYSTTIAMNTALGYRDTSISGVWTKLVNVDTSLLNLGTKNTNQDVSLNSIWTNFGLYTTNASVNTAGFENKLDVDTSFGMYATNSSIGLAGYATNVSIGTAAYAKNASLSLYELSANIDSSLALYELATNIDTSFGLYSATTQMNTAFGYRDTSISGIWTKFGSVDTSLNNLALKTHNHDGTYLKEVSIGTGLTWSGGTLNVSATGGVSQGYVDGSFGLRDVSILWLQNNTLNITSLYPYATNASVGLVLNSYATNASINSAGFENKIDVDTSLNSIWTNFSTYATNASINTAAFAKNASLALYELAVNADTSFGLYSTTVQSNILYNPDRLFTILTAPVASSGTTEKVLLQLAIPAARAISGSTFRAWVMGNSSSTGTLIFKARCGANGSITDAIGWTAVTSAGQAVNARAGFEVLVTVRSATTLYTDGIAYAGAVQLPTVIAAPATSAITISGNWYINLTVICSSGTFTAQVGNIEEIR